MTVSETRGLPPMSFRDSTIHYRAEAPADPGRVRYAAVSAEPPKAPPHDADHQPALGYCRSSALRDHVAHALKPWGEVRFAEDWAGFAQLARTAPQSVLLVATEWIEDDPGIWRLAALRRDHPLAPIVLVTRDGTRNLLALKDLSVDEVVLIGGLGPGLAPALRRAEQASWLRQVADEIQRNARVGPHLRKALAHGCAAPRPFVSVASLAHTMACDRATLAREWREAVGPDPRAARLEDFVDWVLVLHAWAIRAGGSSWSDAASRLGISAEGLRRRVKRLSGMTLRGLADLSSSEIRALLRSRVLVWLAT